MNYFSNLPTIDYNFLESTETIRMKNIFYKLNLNIGSEVVKIYKINEIKRIDVISFELYGTTEYWWIICLLNNIQDIIFDLPVQIEILKDIALKQTLAVYSLISDPGALDYYNSKLDELIEQNEEKRKIWIVDPVHINKIIQEIIKIL